MLVLCLKLVAINWEAELHIPEMVFSMKNFCVIVARDRGKGTHPINILMILCMYLVKHRESLTTHQTCLSGFVYDIYIALVSSFMKV